MKYVAIKDMEIPFCCEVCDFRKSDPFTGDVYCNKLIENIISDETVRLDNCPLIEIVTCCDCVYGVFGECKKFHHYTMKDDFCSFGKRRE